MALCDLKAGDYAWIESQATYGIKKKSVRMAKISHAAKGRLFICMVDGRSGSKLLIDNWRYGFDVETGKAHHYPNDTMIAPTAIELANYLEQQAKDKANKERKEQLDSIREDKRQELLALFSDRNSVESCSDDPQTWEVTIRDCPEDFVRYLATCVKAVIGESNP